MSRKHHNNIRLPRKVFEFTWQNYIIKKYLLLMQFCFKHYKLQFNLFSFANNYHWSLRLPHWWLPFRASATPTPIQRKIISPHARTTAIIIRRWSDVEKHVSITLITLKGKFRVLLGMSDKMFTCPYNPAHVMRPTRAHHHVVNCRKVTCEVLFLFQSINP